MSSQPRVGIGAAAEASGQKAVDLSERRANGRKEPKPDMIGSRARPSMASMGKLQDYTVDTETRGP